MNATLTKISITSLKIDDHSVEVPAGLSELLVNTWSAEKKQTKHLAAYDRKVVKVDGRFTTILTKK